MLIPRTAVRRVRGKLLNEFPPPVYTVVSMYSLRYDCEEIRHHLVSSF